MLWSMYEGETFLEDYILGIANSDNLPVFSYCHVTYDIANFTLYFYSVLFIEG